MCFYSLTTHTGYYRHFFARKICMNFLIPFYFGHHQMQPNRTPCDLFWIFSCMLCFFFALTCTRFYDVWVEISRILVYGLVFTFNEYMRKEKRLINDNMSHFENNKSKQICKNSHSLRNDVCLWLDR